MRYVPFALPPAAFAKRVERLRWDFRKWDTHVRGRCTVQPGALVLDAAELATAARVAEDLDAATRDAARRWCREPEMTRVLGVPAELAPLAREPGPRATRIDLFLTDEGWRASEGNDDVPGGYNDSLGLPFVFADCVEKGLEAPGDLPDAIARLFASHRRVGLVYATAYAEDLQVVRLLADLLEMHGHETILASPAHLAFDDGRATLAGEPVDAIYRFFPGEWFALLPNLGAWRDAIAAGLPVVNPFANLWTQSKAAYAFLRHPAIPSTRVLTPEVAREARAGRERWVLKPAFGRMGEGVTLGAACSAKEWSKSLAGALQRPSPWVLQERFRPRPVETGDGASVVACVGAYVVDGRFAGCYGRTSTSNVVRHDAANVLTLLEAV